jgi:hypothetical protein
MMVPPVGQRASIAISKVALQGAVRNREKRKKKTTILLEA